MECKEISRNKPIISIVTPCYNEELNVAQLITKVRDIMAELPYPYEHILIDNHSTDRTWEILKGFAAEDKRIKIIRNVRNFGGFRSPAHALYQAKGAAAILISSDLQDPPELIPKFLEEWEQGYKVVLGQKTSAEESIMMYRIRSLYYKIIQRFSDIPEYAHVTGFGLFDQEVVRQMEELDEPEPSTRHLIADLGYEAALVPFRQPKRKRGKSGFGLAVYIPFALRSLIMTSRAPLVMAVLLGFFVSLGSFGISMIYLIYKLVNWSSFQLGQAPILIGIFFIGGVLLMFMGIIGEYIGEVLTRVTKRPLVIEQERVNFEEPVSQKAEYDDVLL